MGAARAGRTGKRRGRSYLRNQSFLAFMAMATWILLSGLACIWCQLEVVRGGYEVSRAIGEQTRLLQTNGQLKVEVGRLRSAGRIESIALGRLGMTHPTGHRKVVIE